MEKLLRYAGLGELAPILDGPVRAVLVLLVTWVVLRVARRVSRKLLAFSIARHEDDVDAQRRATTIGRTVNYAITVIVVVVGLMLTLAEIGLSIAPFLATAGIAGVAIGFGAQSLVKDYFTGLVLLIENQVRIGDVVALGGQSGAVEEVTLRYIRLRDYSGNVHFIPNGAVSIVTNMTREFAYAVVDAAVGHFENTDSVVASLRQIGTELRGDATFAAKILADLEIAGVESIGENSVVVRCRFKVTAGDQWTIKRELLRRMKQAFDREGIEIPFPQLSVHLEKEPAAA